jgi:hypothetical protein
LILQKYYKYFYCNFCANVSFQQSNVNCHSARSCFL